MQFVTSISEMQQLSDKIRSQGTTIAVVPTMGYLHEGHLSLIRLAKQNSDFVIVTIFVNPTQFAPNEDFERYPRDINRDLALCRTEPVDVVFAPETSAMYNSNFLTFVNVEKITEILEGKFRPSHFRGVATVVAKLFNITKPHIAIFGQKDAQQAIVIKKMVKDLNYDIKIIIGPTVRENDGLAMSSRNVYLKDDERKDAAVLYQSLKFAESQILNGETDLQKIKSDMEKIILSKPNFTIDYISFNDAETLDDLSKANINRTILISLAARIGYVRLIDNILVKK